MHAALFVCLFDSLVVEHFWVMKVNLQINKLKDKDYNQFSPEFYCYLGSVLSVTYASKTLSSYLKVTDNSLKWYCTIKLALSD